MIYLWDRRASSVKNKNSVRENGLRNTRIDKMSRDSVDDIAAGFVLGGLGFE